MTKEEREDSFTKHVKYIGGEYADKMLDAFILYWTESSPNGKKMRYEMEKVFDVKRRLATWANNEKKFNGGKGVNQKGGDGFIDRLKKW